MQHLLFTNIGNRNLSFDGFYFDKDYKSNFTKVYNPLQLSYYDYTEKIYESLQEGIAGPKIQLNIILPLIEAYYTNKQRFSRIHLISTESGHENDTYFTALIIKHLLMNVYGFDEGEISISRIKFPITETNNLLNFYRNQLHQFKNDYYIRLCDAGGSPQQKSAMKIMAEFVLDDACYDVLYVTQKNEITVHNQIEYRTIINSHAVEKLAAAGNYLGALELRNKSHLLNLDRLLQEKNKTDRLLVLGHIAMHNAWKKQAWKISKIEHHAFTLNALVQRPLRMYCRIQHLNFLTVFKDKKDAFLTGEFLYLAWFFFQRKDFNQSIMHFTRFYESLFDELIRHKTGIDVVGETDKLKAWLTVYLPDLAQKYSASVVSEVMLIEKLYVDEDDVLTLIKTISKHLTQLKITVDAETNEEKVLPDPLAEKRINNVRNKIAHEGLLVDEAYLDQHLSYYSLLLLDLQQLLQMDMYDLFGELNKTINQELTSRNI